MTAHPSTASSVRPVSSRSRARSAPRRVAPSRPNTPGVAVHARYSVASTASSSSRADPLPAVSASAPAPASVSAAAATAASTVPPTSAASYVSSRSSSSLSNAASADRIAALLLGARCESSVSASSGRLPMCRFAADAVSRSRLSSSTSSAPGLLGTDGGGEPCGGVGRGTSELRRGLAAVAAAVAAAWVRSSVRSADWRCAGRESSRRWAMTCSVSLSYSSRSLAMKAEPSSGKRSCTCEIWLMRWTCISRCASAASNSARPLPLSILRRTSLLGLRRLLPCFLKVDSSASTDLARLETPPDSSSLCCSRCSSGVDVTSSATSESLTLRGPALCASAADLSE